MLFAVNISIHAPPRGATCTADCGSRGTQNFNSRPSARGDDFVRRRRAGLDISIHAPPRGATSENTEAMNMLEISIHAPPRGATHCCERMSTIVLFQFTPLREGRHKSFLQSGESGTISIHAPPRGATEYDKLRVLYHKIFQFTPLREGRPQQHHGVSGLCNFNSRPSARGDAQPRNRQARCSAHFNSRPSARGDKILQPDAVEKLIFQFTPLREGRPPDRLRISRRSHFNSRPSARGDRRHPPAACHRRYFNSRPSARGDVGVSSPPAQPHISIHAPPRGATSGAMVLFGWHTISIHAPPRGATAYSACSAAGGPFQFTPLREGRLYYLWFAIWIVKFQFTPLREGRRRTSKSGRNSTYFNSRPSARGDVVRFFCTRKEVFQFTPLREGRQLLVGQLVLVGRFQFTPLREGRRNCPLRAHLGRISIHAPPRGATSSCWAASAASVFQFTPLREGRRTSRKSRKSCRRISIHAPPRGATRVRHLHTACRYFNSRPSARGDVLVCDSAADNFRFQFTPLREGRRIQNA